MSPSSRGFKSAARNAAGLAVVVATVVVVVLVTRTAGSARAAPPLPSHALVGSPVSIAALRGRPLLIDFFASWCGPCRAEAPTLERVARELHGRARVVAVDWSDSRRFGLQFVNRFHWSFPVLDDPNGVAGDAYGVAGLPAAFVLDASGRVVRRLVGPQTASGLVRALQAARAKQM